MNNWKRNIAMFITGQSITLFGSMLVYYAVLWHITLKTQSGLMMTLITASGALPMFFISPFAGVWADRYNKKHIINIADAVIAAVTLGMAIIFSLDFEFTGLLLMCLVMRALGQGVQTPAVNALIPELVPKEHLTRVNGINGGLQSFVMFASPMAGGILLAFAPIHVLMFVDVVTAIIGISILYFFVKIPVRSQQAERKAGAKQLNLFNPPMMAALQTSIDAEYMGRVFSVLNMMGSVMMPLGMVLWGPLGDVVAIGWLLIGTGAVIFFMGFVFLLDTTLLKAGMSDKNKTDCEGL